MFQLVHVWTHIHRQKMNGLMIPPIEFPIAEITVSKKFVSPHASCCRGKIGWLLSLPYKHIKWKE